MKTGDSLKVSPNKKHQKNFIIIAPPKKTKKNIVKNLNPFFCVSKMLHLNTILFCVMSLEGGRQSFLFRERSWSTLWRFLCFHWGGKVDRSLFLYDFNVLDSTGQMSSCGPVVEIQSTLLKDDKMQMASEVGWEYVQAETNLIKGDWSIIELPRSDKSSLHLPSALSQTGSGTFCDNLGNLD